MVVNNSMSEFFESRQKSFDEACCAFAIEENMAQLARQVGMSEDMLRAKLNPGQRHVLKPVELVAISKASRNYTLVNSLLLGLELVAAPVEASEDTDNLMTRLLKHSANAGELSSLAIAQQSQKSLSRTSRQKFIQKAQAGINNLVLLINDVENRTTVLQPLVQFGSDFLMNGSPIPGLS